MTTASSDIAIIGFGFGGLMVLANLVARAEKPLTIDVIAPDTRGYGLAYGTENILHLLNVPARNMGAFAREPEHFTQWLSTVPAEMARQELELKALPGPDDFAPRALYARYLHTLRHALLLQAKQKNITVRFVEVEATALQPATDSWEITAGDTTRRARRCLIATGHETKPLFPGLPPSVMIEDPWAITDAKPFGKHPIVIVGTGLTAIDMVLSLRRMGYHGMVHAISRNGLMPLPHQAQTVPFVLDADALYAQTSLLGLVRAVRASIRTHARAGGDWRAVIDALRPHTIALWQRLSPREQSSFMRRLGTVWNTHRHRMAPDIARIMQQEIAAGKLKLGASRHLHPVMEEGELKLAVHWAYGEQEILKPAAILNCTGPELNWERSARPLLQGLARDGHVEIHPTGVGVRANNRYRIGRNLYAIGNPMTGQFWESTAVPELRQQASIVAEELCNS